MSSLTSLSTNDVANELKRALAVLKRRHLELEDADFLEAVIRSGVDALLKWELVHRHGGLGAVREAGGVRPFPKPGVAKGTIENYLATPIDADLRRRLGLFVAKHPELTEEEAVAHLLDAALHAIESENSGEVSLERAAFRARLRLLRFGRG